MRWLGQEPYLKLMSKEKKRGEKKTILSLLEYENLVCPLFNLNFLTFLCLPDVTVQLSYQHEELAVELASEIIRFLRKYSVKRMLIQNIE